MHHRLAAFKDVHKFYKELWKWIVAGYPQHPVFHKDKAICSSLNSYLEGCSDVKSYERVLICRIQNDIFQDVYGDEGLPFNKNIVQFCDERRSSRLYRNQLRLAWIYKQSH